jgi:hypothetical protein
MFLPRATSIQLPSAGLLRQLHGAQQLGGWPGRPGAPPPAWQQPQPLPQPQQWPPGGGGERQQDAAAAARTAQSSPEPDAEDQPLLGLLGGSGGDCAAGPAAAGAGAEVRAEVQLQQGGAGGKAPCCPPPSSQPLPGEPAAEAAPSCWQRLRAALLHWCWSLILPQQRVGWDLLLLALLLWVAFAVPFIICFSVEVGGARGLLPAQARAPLRTQRSKASGPQGHSTCMRPATSAPSNACRPTRGRATSWGCCTAWRTRCFMSTSSST